MLTVADFLFPLASLLHIVVVGQALDVLGWRLEHLFYYANTAGFLLMPLECRKRDNSLGPSIPRDSLLPRETGQSNTFYQ